MENWYIELRKSLDIQTSPIFSDVLLMLTVSREQAFLAHLSRRLKGELIVYPCSGVRRCRRRRRRRRRSPFSNMNISEASWPIKIKFYLKHHWGVGKAAWGFGADQFRTLVSMATDSSHRVIMGKQRHQVFSNVFDRILFILAGNDDMHESLDEFAIWPDSTTDYGVSCP